MNLGDIISEALIYPLHNIKALVLYIVLGIIAAIVGGTSIIAFLTAAGTTGASSFALDGVAILGIIVFIILLFLIEGYGLDIVKYGIERRSGTPNIDFARQVSNAIKLLAVDIAYYLIPAVIIFVLGFIFRDWILTIISIILVIVFALANFMARCRLAKTDSLGEALAVGEAIGDISRVGIGKLITTILIIIIIAVAILFVTGLVSRINTILGNVLLGIAMVYLVLFYHRVIGLLYSEV